MNIFRGSRSLSLGLILMLSLTLFGCASRRLDENPVDSPSAEKLEAQKRASIRMQLAIGYYQQGQQKVALDEIREALKISPDLVDAYSVRAVIFMDMGEKQLAEENFLYALKLAPNHSDIMNNYGWFLCQNGREKDGLAYLDKVIKDSAYPTPGKALNNAGLCSLHLKDIAGAERYFMQGLKEEPANPAINANIANILYDRGQYGQAKFYIDRVMNKFDVIKADVLWLAIRIEKKLGDAAAVNGLATQLRRRYPNSREYTLFQRGAFDE